MLRRTSTAIAMTLMLATSEGHAEATKILHEFCSQGGNNCTDGGYGNGHLITDRSGNIYGTVANGGIYSGGGIFKLTPGGTCTLLYSFCAERACTDGQSPEAGLIADGAGNLYGTTTFGGTQGQGTVFELTSDGTEIVLYSFTGGSDGSQPEAPLLRDGTGNLFGTTYSGGARANGTVFKVAPDGTESVLYAFCAKELCADGSGPLAGVVADKKGNPLGTTLYGGNGSNGGYNGDGVVFKITPEGKETVLHAFCAQQDCADGYAPMGGLTHSADGNFYGTTFGGGSGGGSCSVGCGTVYKVTPSGPVSVVYSFGSDGLCFPQAGVVLDKPGNFYGTTTSGCSSDTGTVVFKLPPGGTATALHVFDGLTSNLGAEPALALDAKSGLFGDTQAGGTNGGGAVYQLKK